MRARGAKDRPPQRGHGQPRTVLAAMTTTDAVAHVFAVLAIIGQVLVGLVILLALADLASVAAGKPANGLRSLRRGLDGTELWLAFIVAAAALAGSLFFSEYAHFVPCRLCWFQRICMYPLAPTLLWMALAKDRRAARYLLPLPIVGAGISVYHLLVENHWVKEAQGCLISAPGGCAVKWINVFGYLTIPTLALTAFLMLTVLLLMAWREPHGDGAGVPVMPEPALSARAETEEA
jgi:disulfide bond formation protein DsbB